jgi:hypothetical protein
MLVGLHALAQEMPRTTTERLKGTPTVKTETLHGTVAYVEGNRLVVKMASGDLRTFTVPDSRRFNIDGQELKVNDLKPGTTLTATVKTTTTPVTERTTTVGTGTVWYVAGNTVILTLPNNENRMYKVKDSYRFTVNGQQASVHDLRKGMVISAEKITEEPNTEVASETAVVGHAPAAPKPKSEAARAMPPEPAPTPAPRPAPAPAPAAAAPAPTPAPAPEPAPKELPHTASPLPLIGLAGLSLMAGSLALRRLGRNS